MELTEYLVKFPVAYINVSTGNELEATSALLASKIVLPIQKAYIISFDIHKTNSLIKEYNMERNISVVSYQESDLLKLKDVQNSLILFDNLSYLINLAVMDKFTGLDVSIHFARNRNWVVILGNQTILATEIKQLSEAFPKAYFWTDKFIDFGNCINYTLNKSKMKEEQETRYMFSEKYYYDYLKNPPNKTCWKSDNYTNIKRFCNIVYPPNIQNLLENPILDYEFVPTTENTVKTFGVSKILDHSPKFRQLVEKIILKAKCRHVVYTSFGSFFGAGIIEEILKALDISVLRVDYEQSIQKNIENSKLFNEDESYKVLVINTCFFEDPINVNYYHIMDSNLKEAFSKIFEIYKYKNYTTTETFPPTLDVHMYCTSRNKDCSIDDLMYDEFFPFVLRQRDFAEYSKNQSANIIVNAQGRLDVVR